MSTKTKSIGVAFEDQQLDGAIMGKSGGTAGFYGTTPIVQAAAITAVGNTATANTFGNMSIYFIITTP